MTLSSLQELPDEVIYAILGYTSAPTAISLSMTCRRFHDIANAPLLWKAYCQTDFRWWSASHHQKAVLCDPSYHDWKTLYVARAAAPRPTKHLIDQLIRNSGNQIDRVAAIIALGYDAKDTLLDLFHQSPSSPNHLSQKYWSHVALGSLHRSLALEGWQNLRFHEEADDTTVRAVGAFDLFILDERPTGDLDDIFAILDSYAQAIRTDFPEIDTLAPRHKASVVAAYLLRKGWTGITTEEGRAASSYHALEHMFLGVALHSTNHNSLPLITALIYCHVLRCFNLSAQPISYPWHVHAIVRPPPGIDLDGNPTDVEVDPSDTSPQNQLFMDPFNNATPVPRSQLEQQLSFIAPQLPASERATFLLPASAREMTLRAARNILKADSSTSLSTSAGPPPIPISAQSSSYAATWASALLPASVQQLRHSLQTLLHDIMEHHPEDISLFETHVLPLTTQLRDRASYAEMCRSVRTMGETERVKVKRRSGNSSDSDRSNDANPAGSVAVKYKVGQVFTHRRRGYVGVVYGWDERCEMDERWIAVNQVASLPGGREQPFYNVLVHDNSTRYVAEENIEVMEQVEQSDVDAFPIVVGKYFKRWDGERNVFVSNVREQYPED